MVLIQSILNSKQKTKTKQNFLALKIQVEKMLPFFRCFFSYCNNIRDRQFLGDLFSSSKRVILLLPELQVSYGVLGKFFSQIGSVADPGCLSRIPDPDFFPSRIPDPKKHGEVKNFIF